jgi:hypothetical protein
MKKTRMAPNINPVMNEGGGGAAKATRRVRK